MEQPKRITTTAERLKEALDAKGWKPYDLAKKAEISHSTISRYLSGSLEPRRTSAHKLAVVLGVSEFWLWGYEVPADRPVEQKKNDHLAVVVEKLRKDPELLGVVDMLLDMPAEDLASISRIVSALRQQQLED